ncbi:cytochrome oxidase maturation protein, cbb3-type [Acidihalobacter aeolianus]|uniref:Cytochrome oxidase maturation protein, cbb3-type n=1 Tax=Acidihalobacter aeolianus TaxID=2792603 RepID=A0A1D8KB08_9GAMM|nr:cbb3-type cytochrome oxidase assembly protein CcoS [Acidihalobacter aeolianus]AOV18141.1 cytochrome oxidase maturation protein, cbb3-type [Acidihalobacter aeolianus]
MNILYLLLPLAGLLALIAVLAFVWTVKSGQYDDLDGPPQRMLMDDDDPRLPGRDAGTDKRPGSGRS